MTFWTCATGGSFPSPSEIPTALPWSTALWIRLWTPISVSTPYSTATEAAPIPPKSSMTSWPWPVLLRGRKEHWQRLNGGLLGVSWNGNLLCSAVHQPGAAGLYDSRLYRLLQFPPPPAWPRRADNYGGLWLQTGCIETLVWVGRNLLNIKCKLFRYLLDGQHTKMLQTNCCLP